MDSASRKASDGPAANAEPDLRAGAPGDKAVQVWAFLCPNPMCGTELIVLPEQTGQWVECPSCGLQLRAPEVVPGKDDTLYPVRIRMDVPQRPVRRRKMPADQAARLAIEALGAAPKPKPAAPEVAEAADALDSLARTSHENAEAPPGATEAPPAPQAPSELRFRDESQPLAESALREALPKPPDEPPWAQSVARAAPARVARAAPVTHAEPVARPALPGRGSRKFRPNLVVVWIVAVLAAAGIGFLAWLTGLPDLAAGSILAVGAALLWTFFGHASDEATPPDGPPW